MNKVSEMNLVDVDKLIPYVNNARTHSKEQINKLRASIREFGFINPVIIDRDYNVIAMRATGLKATTMPELNQKITEICGQADMSHNTKIFK